MTKPVQIQPVAWLNTQHEPVDEYDFDIAGPIDGRKLNEVYPGRWTPLISIADIRSLLEAKAKEWNSQRLHCRHLEIYYYNGKSDAAEELLALAAPLGNQEKRSD